MKLFRVFPHDQRAQSAIEYLLLFGVAILVTLWAFDTLLPQVVSADGNSGSAVKYFGNIMRKITESH